MTFRRLFLITAFAVTITGSVYAQTPDHNTDYGFVGFEGNEQTVGSKVDDPPKIRLTSPITEHGSGGGVISFNMHTAFGTPVFGHGQTEMAMLRVEQAEDVRGDTNNAKAEFNFLCNDGFGGNDANMQKCLSFTYTGITRISPGIAQSIRDIAAGVQIGQAPLPPSYSPPPPPTSMWSPDGRYVTQQQNDGNFVTYDTYVPGWKAVWSAWTGFIH